jgi:hypothetical protein
MKGGVSRLQRGQPNSASSGLEKPSPVVVVPAGAGQARPRIKMSFNSKGGDDRPKLALAELTAAENGKRGVSEPRQSSSSKPAGTATPTTAKAISHSDSIASLR